MFPTGSWVWTLGPQLCQCFEIIEPSKVKTWLMEMGHWEKSFEDYCQTALFPVRALCFHIYQDVNKNYYTFPLPWWNVSCQAFLIIMHRTLWTTSQSKCFLSYVAFVNSVTELRTTTNTLIYTGSFIAVCLLHSMSFILFYMHRFISKVSSLCHWITYISLYINTTQSELNRPSSKSWNLPDQFFFKVVLAILFPLFSY